MAFGDTEELRKEIERLNRLVALMLKLQTVQYAAARLQTGQLAGLAVVLGADPEKVLNEIHEKYGKALREAGEFVGDKAADIQWDSDDPRWDAPPT